MKVGDLINDAFSDILVKEEGVPIEAGEAQLAIRELNRMMSAWSALGMPLGYTQVSNLGETLTVPDGALMGMAAQLAINLAPSFKRTVSPALVQKRKLGMQAVRNLSVNTGEQYYPDILPRGSGNTYPTQNDHPFYTDQQNTILTETGGSIALEDETQE